MIRVPSIAINRPWTSPRGRRQTSSPADVLGNVEEEVATQRLRAAVERERSEVFSRAFLTGRPLF